MIDHKTYFALQKSVKPQMNVVDAGQESQAEEIRYQAFKARFIEETGMVETPEQRAAWVENMVIRKEKPPELVKNPSGWGHE